MISSLNRVLSVSGLVLALTGFAGAALCADTAPAQTGAPPADRSASADASGADQTQPSQPGEVGGPGFVNPFTPVQSQTLGDVEADLVGVIDAQSGGFKPDMWSGTDRLIVEIALPHLPVATTSPAAMSLARRLLLTRAQSPEGATHGASLIAERLERVLAIGQVGAIDAMVQQTGDQSSAPGIAGVAVDAFFYEGKDKEACDIAEKQRGIAKSTDWTKRLAFCSALAGKTAEARLGVDVLSATGDQDQGFAALMSKWLDKAKLTTLKITAPNAVHFALLRHTQVGIDSASLASAGPAFLTAWEAYDKAPMPQRLLAAERATSAGMMTPDALRKLYGQVKIAPELLAKKFDAKLVPAGTLGIAYAVQKLPKLKDNDARGHLIALALTNAEKRNALSAISILLRNGIATTNATPALADVAPVLAVGAVMAGDASQAKRWLELMNAQGQGASESASALRSFLAAATGDADLQWTADQFLARYNATSSDDRPHALLEWVVLRALGGAGSDAMTLAMLDAPPASMGFGPTPAVTDALKSAAAHNHLAEAVMFSLMALSANGPRDAQVVALQLSVGALTHVGLTSDARAIAAEALAAQMP